VEALLTEVMVVLDAASWLIDMHTACCVTNRRPWQSGHED